jgi:hypothetical protein
MFIYIVNYWRSGDAVLRRKFCRASDAIAWCEEIEMDGFYTKIVTKTVK